MDHHSVKYVNSSYQHVMTADYVNTVLITAKGVVMSEPQLDDDIALDKDSNDCADCEEHMSQCSCGEPDRMYGDED